MALLVMASVMMKQILPNVVMMVETVVEVVPTLKFVPNVPALVILLATYIQILCLEMAFAMTKQTL